MSEKKRKKYWAGYVDGKVDDTGWRLAVVNDIYDLVSVFRTRKTARKAFEDVRAVYVVPVEAGKPKRKA